MKDLELYQIDSLGMAAEDYKGLLAKEEQKSSKTTKNPRKDLRLNLKANTAMAMSKKILDAEDNKSF